MYANWQVWTWIGIFAGQTEQVRQLGLEFAAAFTFIGMLIPMIKNRPILLATVAAGAASLLLNSLPSRLGLIAAALIGITVGALADAVQQKTQKEARS